MEISRHNLVSLFCCVLFFHYPSESSAPQILWKHLASCAEELYTFEVSDFSPSFKVLSRSVQKPSPGEIDENPRSRSAKLRLAVRTRGDVFDREESLLPAVPTLAEFGWAA